MNWRLCIDKYTDFFINNDSASSEVSKASIKLLKKQTNCTFSITFKKRTKLSDFQRNYIL